MRNNAEIVVKRSEPHAISYAGGQLDTQELPIRMALVPLPGIYEFRLIANYAHLEDGGTALLRVFPG